MKQFSKGSGGFWLVLMVCAFALLACDVGSLISQVKPAIDQAEKQTQSQTQGQTEGQPTKAAGSGSATSIPAPSKDAQSRISDSLNRVVVMEDKVLDSYHLEVSGMDPEWNKDTKKVETYPFTFKADVSGDDVHFIKTVKAAKETTTEGYIIDLNSKDNTKGYSVTGGKVQEDLFMPLAWAMLPLEYGMPLIFGAMGPTPRGDEAVDGRAAEKFDLDMSKAPTGAEGMLKSMGFGMKASKGTAWIDKQNGALLKMNLDYTADVQDAGKVVGQGNGHIELTVTQVGKVTVKLPDASSSGPAAPTTAAAKGAATATRSSTAKAATPTPTAAPGSKTGRVGQRIVAGGVALTVTKAQALDTFGGEKAETGNTWVVATVTVENTSNERVSVEWSQFEYVDKDGSVVDGLLNGPSAPGTTGKDVMDYHELLPKGKLTNKTLPIQMEKTLLKGLQLLFTIDDENSIIINLGLPTGPTG